MSNMKAIYEREAYGNVSIFINGRIKLLNCSKGKMSMCAKSLQLCSTLCNPTDCSPPGSSVHGILQARTLEWVAMPSFRGSSPPSDQTCVSHTGRQILYLLSLQGNPPSSFVPDTIALALVPTLDVLCRSLHAQCISGRPFLSM